MRPAQQCRLQSAASLEEEVTLHPGSIVGRDAVVETGALVGTRAEILDGTRLGAGATICAEAVVGPRATIGDRTVVGMYSAIGSVDIPADRRTHTRAVIRTQDDIDRWTVRTDTTPMGTAPAEPAAAPEPATGQADGHANREQATPER